MSRKIERAKIRDRVYKHPGKLLDRFFLRAAKIGDWEELASYIERGGEITPAMRVFLARVLRGQEKRLPNRPPSGVTAKEQLTAAAYALALKAAGVRDSRVETSKQFNVNAKYLERALALWKAFDPRYEEVETVIAAITPSLSLEARKALQPYFNRDKNRGPGWAIAPFNPTRVMTKKSRT
jgi:hypothetical protein